MAPPARAWAYLLKQPVALVQPGHQTGEPRVRRVPACAACTLKSQAKSVFQRNAVLAQLVLRRTIKKMVWCGRPNARATRTEIQGIHQGGTPTSLKEAPVGEPAEGRPRRSREWRRPRAEAGGRELVSGRLYSSHHLTSPHPGRSCQARFVWASQCEVKT